MAPDAMKLITSITCGQLTEQMYDDLLFDYIFHHKIMNDVLRDKMIPDSIKVQIKSMRTLDDIRTLLEYTSLINHKKNIESLLVPYTDYTPFLQLKGCLGFISSIEIQLPDDLISKGFNSKNNLLNLSQNKYVKSEGFWSGKN